MNTPQQEMAAKSMSEILSWILFCVLLSFLSYFFVMVDYQGIYSGIFTVVLIYLAVGSVIMRHKRISPPATKKIAAGKPDIEWGFVHLYWSAWWPIYLKRNPS